MGGALQTKAGYGPHRLDWARLGRPRVLHLCRLQVGARQAQLCGVGGSGSLGGRQRAWTGVGLGGMAMREG